MAQNRADVVADQNERHSSRETSLHQNQAPRFRALDAYSESEITGKP